MIKYLKCLIYQQRLRKLENIVREIQHRCFEIIKEEEILQEDVNPNPNSTQTQPHVTNNSGIY